MPDFFAPCPRGLEALLQQDLEACGASQVVRTEGGVSFSGDWALCYRVNLENRVASRVLWRVAQGIYRSEHDIYKLAFELQWQRWFDVEKSIRVDTTAIRCQLKSLEFITLRVKDAICDRFRAYNQQRPSVNTAEPNIRVQVFIEDNTISLYIDTSGEALFKRGVRSFTNEAPLRENLAAGILRLAKWAPGTPLCDPMCGSGTFLLEAISIALNIQPGIQRHFAFEHLRNFDQKLWQNLREKALAAQKPATILPIWGSDISAMALQAAEQNLLRANLLDCVSLDASDILDLQAPSNHGVLIANLPYGERMGELEALAEFYPKLGDSLKRHFAGWTAYLLTADLTILKRMRLSPSRKTPLFNGAIECRLLEYKMVSGKNR